MNYSNVMATVAVFIALGGGAWALSKNSVGQKQLKKNSVGASEILKGAVDSNEVKNENLTGSDLAPNTVAAADIATGAIGSGEILDGAVGTADLAGVPAVSVRRASDLPAANASGTPVPFDSDTSVNDAQFDSMDMWDPATPGDVVVPRDGLYLAVAEAEWEADDTATPGGPGDQGYRQVEVLSTRAGVFGVARIGAARQGSTVAVATFHQASGVANLQAGDAIRVDVSQANEDSSTVDATDVSLIVVWLGPGV